ncbi:MAG: hypothetical protein ACKO8I_02640, partial [Cyanobacteriota bacterium]
MARSHASPSSPACERRGAKGQPAARHRPGQKRRQRQAPACCALPSPPGARAHRPEPRRLTPAQQAFAVRHLGLARQQARRFALRHRLAY